MVLPEAYNGEKPFIFISYAHRDSERVIPIIDRLIQDGYRVWYDSGIEPGNEWDEFIASKITACSYFVCFISENYLNSDNCKDELNFARDSVSNKLLIYLDSIALPRGMEMRLGRIQAIMKYDYTDETQFYKKLYAAKDLDTCKNQGETVAAVVAPVVTPAPETQPVVQPVTQPETVEVPASPEPSVNEVVNAKPSKKSGKAAAIIISSTITALVIVSAAVVLYFYNWAPSTATWLCSHNDIKAATCENPAICKRCGEKQGKPKGHRFEDATCTEAKTCSVCGKTEGRPLGHDFEPATCSAPETCSRCGEYRGIQLLHDWVYDNCESGAVCSMCGLTNSVPLGHDMLEFICTRCGYSDELSTSDDLNQVVSFSTDAGYPFNYYFDDEGHIRFETNITNLASRTIVGIEFDILVLDASGELLFNDDGGNYFYATPSVNLSTGSSYFYESGYSGFTYDESSVDIVRVFRIEITYSDGTTLTYVNPNHADLY